MFKNASEECVDLLKKMIVVDRRKRIKTTEILKHKWFNKIHANESALGSTMDAEVVKSLREFKGSTKLKKAAMNVLVKMLKPKDIEKLKEEFMKIDTDNSGFIEYQELEQALKKSEFSLSSDEL